MPNDVTMAIPGAPGSESPISFEVPETLVTQAQVDQYVQDAYNTAMWGIGGAFALYFLGFRPRHLALLGVGIFGMSAWKKYRLEKGEV